MQTQESSTLENKLDEIVLLVKESNTDMDKVVTQQSNLMKTFKRESKRAMAHTRKEVKQLQGLVIVCFAASFVFFGMGDKARQEELIDRYLEVFIGTGVALLGGYRVFKSDSEAHSEVNEEIPDTEDAYS